MARPLRIEYPNGWYHILCRGKRKELIFIDKRDYYRFIDLLKDSSAYPRNGIFALPHIA